MLSPEESPSNRSGAHVVQKLFISAISGCGAMLCPIFTKPESLPDPITSSTNIPYIAAVVLSVYAIYNIYDQAFPAGHDRYSRSCGESNALHLGSIDRVVDKTLDLAVDNSLAYHQSSIPGPSRPVRFSSEFPIKK